MTNQMLLYLCPVLMLLLMLALPHFTRPDLLFGVPIPSGFRATEPGRRAVARFRWMVVIPSALSWLAVLLFRGQLAAAALIVGLCVIPVSGVAAFVVQNQKLKPFAIQPTPVRELELDVEPEPLPRFLFWLGLPPLALLGGTALYLHSIWDRIPLSFPVHFDLNGAPNRWADRSVRGVYGPLMLGGELVIVMLAIAIAGWYGTRRTEPLRKPMLDVMLTVEWTMALLFSAVSLNVAAGFPVPVLVLALGPLVLITPA